MYPCNDSYEPITSVPIVSGASTYHHPNGESYILIVNEALYYGNMLKHMLLNPNQVRHHGHGYWDNPYDQDRPLGIELNEEGIWIPMKYNGTKLSFESSVPTDAELNSFPHIELTSSFQWEPGDVELGINAVETWKKPPKRLRTVAGISSSHASPVNEVKYQYIEPSSDDAIMHDMNPAIVRLSQLQVHDNGMVHHNDGFNTPPINAFISHERHRKLSAESLAESWGIGLKKAKSTINATTQRFKRSAILPISRRYHADRFYDTKRLNAKFSTYTLWADVKSLNQHKYVHLFTQKWFCCCLPMFLRGWVDRNVAIRTLTCWNTVKSTVQRNFRGVT